MHNKKRRHLISLADLADDDLNYLVCRGLDFSDGTIDGSRLLKGLVIGIYFRKTSTRTRTAFSSAALRLGAQIISYGPSDLQENTGESIEDTTRVLSCMLDGFVARTAGSLNEMLALASQSRMSVINAMTENEHPTQALADLTTMKQCFGSLSGLRVLYLGEGNNTAAALALSFPRFYRTTMFFCTPLGYGLPDEVISLSQAYAKRSHSTVVQCHDITALPEEIDIVYTTRWETTGSFKEDANWRTVFKPFSVSQRLLEKYPGAIFMHDLPAHRGEEVEASVIDGTSSIAFKQAENKLHSAKAVLDWCFHGKSGAGSSKRLLRSDEEILL